MKHVSYENEITRTNDNARIRQIIQRFPNGCYREAVCKKLGASDRLLQGGVWCELYRVDGGGVAQLSVSGAEFWVAEESPRHLNFSPESLGGCSVRMLLIVEDPAAVCAQAVRAGATEVAPVADDYGWRLGRIVDPFARHWEIGRPPS